MKKKLFILTVFSLLLTACVQDEFVNELPKYDKNGNVILRFSGTAPAMQTVKTRSVDEDGWGLQTTYLYNFDRNHSYLGRTLVTVNEDTQVGGQDAVYTGSFEASVPPSTRYIHLISNLNEKSLEGVHLGMDEVQLIASLATSSSMMGYWGRMELPTKPLSGDKDEIDTEAVKEKSITLVRNQACVQLGTMAAANFTVNAFELFNIYANGMVAPYHTVEDDAYAGFDYTERTLDQTDNLPYVTMPNEPLHASEDISMFENMDANPKYIFEHPNGDDYPIYVILRGRFAPGTAGTDSDQDYYFKASLVAGEENDPVEIWRNYRYNLNIKGNFTLANGTTDRDKAKNLRSVNNVWISLDNSHPKVSDGENVLDVKKVLHVIQNENAANHNFEIPYEYIGDGNVTVSWLANENIFNSTIDTKTKGIIKVQPLHNPTETPERATLLVKAGALRREISLILVKNFVFEGVWCSTNVSSGQKDQLVTLLFDIPQNFPPELFPLECRISTNGIDTKEATKLPIIALSDYIDKGGDINDNSIADGGWGGRFPLAKDLEDSGEDQGLAESWGYKYVYTANEVGVQRVYFLTSIGYGSGEHPEPGHIYVEATNFETTHKQYTFSRQSDWALKMVNTSVYNPNEAKDEIHNVQYKLVAPVKGSSVSVDFQFLKGDNPVTNFGQDMTDIMIFTNAMEPQNPAATYWKWYDAGGSLIEDGTNYAPMTSPSNGGYYYVFNPVDANARQLYDPKTGIFSVPFKTKQPLCADVIRIAVPKDDSYRSASFELSYFDPFHFVSDRDVTAGNTTRSIDADYHADIEVELDVNSVERPVDGRLQGSTGEVMEVSPGETVDCYIYTNNFVVEGATPVSIGCYKYTAKNHYPGTGSYENLSINKLTLKPKDGKVVTAETIVVKSEETQVAFVPLEIRVTDKPITGTICYESAESPIPSDEKVDIITQRNGTRIGTFVIGAGGAYTLRLKGEFDFGWSEALHVMYTAIV